MGALSVWQKLRFGWYLLTCREAIRLSFFAFRPFQSIEIKVCFHDSKEDVEKCKDKDLLQQLLEQFAGEYPQVTEVLVNERDLYLVHSLRKSAEPVHSRLAGGEQSINFAFSLGC